MSETPLNGRDLAAGMAAWADTYRKTHGLSEDAQLLVVPPGWDAADAIPYDDAIPVIEALAKERGL